MALLTGLWLWLTFSSGGFQARDWLLPGAALALFAATAALLAAYPRRPRSLSLVVLGLFAGYTVWVGVSAAWAASVTNAWDETARTLLYLLVFGVAATYLTDRDARRIVPHLLLAGAAVLVGAAVVALRTAGDDTLALLFTGNRFSYPASYPNNAAALYLVVFWPVLWAAADPHGRAPVRGLALGTAAGLICLATLTQSRGAAWALVATIVVMLLLSPARLRTLFYLLVPAALLVWAFPGLNSYWSQGPAAVGGGRAARIVLEAVAVAGGTGVVLALLERWITVTPRMRVTFGTVALLLAVGGSAWGLVAFDRHVGDTRAWLRESWQRLTSDQTTTLPGLENSAGSSAGGSRFATVSLSGRWDIWRVAWNDFRGAPVRGVGAGNFVFTYDRWRHRETAKPRQPHSLELRVLAETGAVGGVLFFGSVLIGLGGILWPRASAAYQRLRSRRLGRSRAGSQRDLAGGSEGAPAALAAPAAPAAPRWGTDSRLYAVNVTWALAVVYWLVHGSVEWLWHMPGVTIPALLILALGTAEVDARAGRLWPRPADRPRAGRGSRFLPALGTTRRREEAAQPAGGEPAGAETVRSATREEAPFSTYRRADRYESRRRRRDRRRDRRERLAAALQPPGPLSRWFRRAATVIAFTALAGTSLPYLSLRYQDLALRNIGSDSRMALANAATAARLQPYDPGPLLVETLIHERDARRAFAANQPGAGLNALAEALTAAEAALARDPAAWALHYEAGRVAAELAARRRSAEQAGGLPPLTEPGAPVQPYASLSAEQLTRVAQRHFAAAAQRNPLSAEVRAAVQELEGE
ncbi:MAG: hypothetical protein Kow00122_03490 [Thermoleophilia bacterium]